MKLGSDTYDVAVIGGGLAGLSAAIQLNRRGYSVILFEKKSYPFHRVCGEYISEESRPFLRELGLPFDQLELPEIRKLMVSSPDGSSLETALTPGGFGISRYRLDELLAGLARSSGVQLMEATKVNNIRYENGVMVVNFHQQEVRANVAIGCFGKRSNLDVTWERPFALAKGGKLNNYIGVKYHVRIDEPADMIALHNFKNGYCGISRVEDGVSCLCYLTTAHNLSLSNNSIAKMETQILMRNPHLARIFNEAEMLWSAPLSISQVSFMPKSKVHDHILMVGDAAGTITPLCGNGMSMALNGSKIVAGQVARFLQKEISRREMEWQYQKQWQKQFSRRLYAGRIIQSFFGGPLLSKILVKAASGFPALNRYLVRQTHGDQF
ncbi:NAD(P)/FAD-dependent oxidoreductase [Flavihumibacter fluvii]|uniref:NAD(P)/FAD-dependent oxidoreductase n=1 Tax=Flavihumibacter fluvii TaxID=2838157 RepID=UPI001BDDFC2A|nr:NAD(P)/FAD-dependent oxidoreductase [Flavihumibacter fluvii]ULQ52603.1 NAD(P)/FAD-dependent oxidoreductase [Flavihumibacter fluvii]